MSKQIDITDTKPGLPHEIKDVVILNYNFEVAYDVIDETSGSSYGDNNTVNVSDVKCFATEEQMEEFRSNAKEYPNDELDSYDIDIRSEYSHVEEDNSTAKKISLIDYFNTDSNSCLRYLDQFSKDNPDYTLVGDFKLVKKTNLTK
jgi:hypothetical protein